MWRIVPGGAYSAINRAMELRWKYNESWHFWAATSVGTDHLSLHIHTSPSYPYWAFVTLRVCESNSTMVACRTNYGSSTPT